MKKIVNNIVYTNNNNFSSVLCCAMLSCSVMSNSLQPHVRQAPLSMGILQARILE